MARTKAASWPGRTARPAKPERASARRPVPVPEADPWCAPSSDGRALRKVAVVSPAMRAVFDLLHPLSRSEVSVTLIGETGTGKDVLARTVHQNSARADGPFVVFDCGAVAANLAEERVARTRARCPFTGALATHAGAFERAHGGTLFLDEVGELPLDLQTRLLRVLGNRYVRRVGGAHRLDPVDVRAGRGCHEPRSADRGRGWSFPARLVFQARGSGSFLDAGAAHPAPPTIPTPAVLALARRLGPRGNRRHAVCARNTRRSPLARQRARAQECPRLCGGVPRRGHSRTPSPASNT